jgi:transposase-like protein
MIPMKKILATLVTAVVIGAGGVAVASAASPSSSTSKPSTSASPDAASKHPGVRAGLRKLGFETAAKTIGLSSKDLVAAMKGGHSIADVAQSHNVSESTVVDAVVKALDARIQQAVDNHTITSDQAAKIDAAIAKRVPKTVEAKPRQLLRHRVTRGAVDVAAKTIGVTPDTLRQAIAGGQSVAQVASAHNVEPSTVVSALVKAGDTRIDTLVAKHHMSSERAAKLKARLPQLAQRFVNHTRDGSKRPAAA